MRLRASLPERNFRLEAESGAASFTFDFQEWFPDEGKVPRNQLPGLARIFWRKFFKADPALYPQKHWPRLLPRAMHQLLWFNEHLVL